MSTPGDLAKRLREYAMRDECVARMWGECPGTAIDADLEAAARAFETEKGAPDAPPL